MRFRRVTTAASVVLLGATLSAVGLSGAAPSNAAAPLFEYSNTGLSSWNVQGLTSDFGGHNIVGGAHAASGDGEFALAARIENGDLGVFESTASGSSSFSNLTTLANAPAPGSDPNVFLDPFDNIDVLYVSTHDHLILISPRSLQSPFGSHVTAHALTANPSPSAVPTRPGVASPFRVTDLSVLSHVAMGPSLPSISVSGTSATIFDRSSKGDAIALPVQWHQVNVAPVIGPARDVSAVTNSSTLLNDPVSMPGVTTAFAATNSAGHVLYFAQNAAGVWSSTDVTIMSASPFSTGPVAIATNGPSIFLASLSTTGHVEFFSASATSASALAKPHSLTARTATTPRLTAPAPIWKYRDLTTVVSGSPTWTGNIVLSATTTSINVAGRAANWGDLYDDSTNLPSTTWNTKDVSLTSGATTSATTQVTGLLNEGILQLFAPGVGTLVARGVGVYAIPSSDWVRAISDGWPIISETGGLGTMSAPWVGFAPPSPLSHSPDYLMGQSIVAAKKRETWLSFWTVSGPLSTKDQTAASYYNHGFLAGQWVAQQIDQYSLLGLNLKPNWVILDPEGYPDNHSALDAPGGSSKATIARYSSYWTAMLNGWATGIGDVDSSLRAGVYASMSEYRNYGLNNTPLPVFEAVAFGGGGPVRIAGSNGPNILGYIAFNGVCTPTSTLRAQESTLLNPPWSGQFNTLQFNTGVYCAP